MYEKKEKNIHEEKEKMKRLQNCLSFTIISGRQILKKRNGGDKFSGL